VAYIAQRFVLAPTAKLNGNEIPRRSVQGLVLKLIATIHVITSYYLAEQNTVMGDSLYAGATQIDGQFQPKWNSTTRPELFYPSSITAENFITNVQ